MYDSEFVTATLTSIEIPGLANSTTHWWRVRYQEQDMSNLILSDNISISATDWTIALAAVGIASVTWS